MSDARLRELERRWQETGAAADEAALLRERLRAGALTWDALALEAYLGHAPAQLALDEPVEPVDFGPDDPAAPTRVGPAAEAAALWTRGLLAWGRETLARALLVRALVHPLDGAPPEWRALLRALEEWCREPRPGAAAEVERPALAVPLLGEQAPFWRLALAAGSVVRECQATPGAHDPLLALAESLGTVRPARVRETLRAWGHAPALGGPLPPGRNLRERVELLITPLARRQKVADLRLITRTSQAALLVYGDRRVEEVLVGSFGYETLQPVLLTYGGAPAAIPLSTVQAVLPPDRPRGLLSRTGYA